MRTGILAALVVPVFALTAVLGVACNGNDNGAGGVATATNGTIEIGAENQSDFTHGEMRAPAGQVTIVFDNRDEGVAHNIAVYPSQDDLGNELGSTDLVAGPSTQELTVELEAGEYYYNCQAHPNMNGTLVVE